MSTPAQTNRVPANHSGGGRALDHLFDEFDRARAEKEILEKRLARFADTIETMLNTLPEIDRDEYRRRFSVVKSGSLPRGGEVFGNVISIFRRSNRRPITVSEVQEILEKEGADLDTKSISNAIAYLARSGRLRRVARGQYVITSLGAGVEMDGYDDGTIRNSEHY